ncbi:MAG: type I restriction endonuclease subunit R [Aeriscardovia sp.]|nr:type I restriction endonuclease subunit R [Aeriscardovia sp.]
MTDNLSSGAQYRVMVDSDDYTVMSEYDAKASGATGYQSEAQLEAAFIDLLQTQGYDYLAITSEADLLANLRAQMDRLNGITLSDREWKRLQVEYLVRPGETIVEKCRRVQVDSVYELTRDDGSHVNVKIVDKTMVTNNRLQVINQYEVTGKHKNRYDVTILVNGLPLVHVELKRRGVDLKQAFNQIDRYQRDSFWAGCGLFEYVQLFVISNGTLTKYYSNTTRWRHVKGTGGNRQAKRKTSDSYEFTSYWADARNKTICDLMHFARTFMERRCLMNVLTKYCVLTDENLLLVMRPYQIAATERVLNRILVSELNPKMLGTLDAGGYVWHATGSGKTLTSFKCAQLACGIEGVDKVLFVVDRKDLDYQTVREYDRFCKGAANSNKSTSVLTKQLGDDSAKIIVTTIQKLSIFCERNDRHAVYGKHVVIIFDECHRSQFGDMRRLISKRFRKYHMFGFTGTPIFAKNAMQAADPMHPTTPQMFGAQLHQYTIVDAINDGNVLPFRVEYCDTVKEGDITDEKVYDIDRKGARVNYGRIKANAAYILDHFDQKTKRRSSYMLKDKRVMGFNSILAAESIPAAMAYYKALDELQDERGGERLRIALIYSWSANEEEPDGIIADEELDVTNLDQTARDYLDAAIARYNETFGCAYSTDGDKFEGYYHDVSRRMKEREIDMLIVVGMFLTGFDATTLNTLWVDKNLRMHGLIQAFSRTNRILNSVKTFGNIVCFRNLEEEVDKALAMYGDKAAGGTVLLKPYADYLTEYRKKVRHLRTTFPLNAMPDPMGETLQRDLVVTFGSILRLRNVLTAWDQFAGDDTMSDRELQDYQSSYIETWRKIREQQKHEATDIVDDLRFEVELVKMVEVNIDYILQLVQKYHDSNCQDKEIVANIERAISASLALRDKRDLIEDFIASMSAGDDAHKRWAAYVAKSMSSELDAIIVEENLRSDETREFMEASFAEGNVSDEGTAVTKILKPMNRFGKRKGTSRAEAKQRAVDRLRAFFDRFFDIAPREADGSVKIG